MYAINDVHRKTGTASRGRWSFLRGRRKDDVTVAGIAVLLVVLFFVQLAWILHRTHP